MTDLAEQQREEWPDSLPSDGRAGGGRARMSADQLAYMADMITELQEMAHSEQLETLAIILNLAAGEAHRAIKGRRGA